MDNPEKVNDFYNKLILLMELLFRPQRALKETIKILKTDVTAWPLLISNLLLLIIVLTENLSANAVIFVYAFQVVIIGFFHLFKYFLFDIIGPNDSEIQGDYSGKKGLYKLLNPKHPIQYDFRRKLGWAIFYVIHFSLFSLFFLRFPIFSIFNGEIISYMNRLFGESTFFVIIGILIFAITHLISFSVNYKKDKQKTWSFGEILLSPYLRGFPIMLIPYIYIILFPLFIFFNGELALLIIFILLKTIVDIITHSLAH